GALVAAVDGIGHGQEAAAAAAVAVATLRAHAQEALLPLLERCHEALRPTRGAVLTVAAFNALAGALAWVGVGSVEGVRLRAGARAQPAREGGRLPGGALGLQRPPLRGKALPVRPGDTLVLATDGVRGGFADELEPEGSPQELADRILAREGKGTD